MRRSSGDTIILSGTFDFTAPFAAAAWAVGNDGIAGNADDYEVSAPRGVNNVTLTATSLGSATIQGPGDLPALDLEAFLVFDASLAPGGGSQGWTISNLRILDFDLSIGMFAVGVSDYNNTTITNNFIRIATDLNATVAPSRHASEHRPSLQLRHEPDRSSATAFRFRATASATARTSPAPS